MRHATSPTRTTLLPLLTTFLILVSPSVGEAKTVFIERRVQSKDGTLKVSSKGTYGWGQRHSSPILVRGKDGQLLQALTGFRDIVYALAISSDNTMIAAAAEAVFIWDSKSGRLLQKCAAGKGSMIDALALSPDTCILAVHRAGETKIHYWDLPSGQKIGTVQDKRIPANLKSLAFSGRSRSLSFFTRDHKPNTDPRLPWPFLAQEKRSLIEKPDDKRRWATLAGKNLERAYQHLDCLAQSPDLALPFIERTLHRIFPKNPPGTFQDLLTRLDAAQDKERELARKELAHWKYLKALQSLDLSQRSVESRYRIREILVTEIAYPAKSVDELLLARCLQLLELIASPAAEKILGTISTARPRATLLRLQSLKKKAKKEAS